MRGRLRLAATRGHNKDHRPDLKQLLYILTVARDGAVPVQFRVQSGNTTDDRSHRDTWDFLCQLTGRCDFLYVADCKLATTENMAYLHRHGGRFLSVLPRTRGEDTAFRAEVLAGRVHWRKIHDRYDDDGDLVDRFSIHEPEATSVEGYRLIWYHSARKAELDAASRLQRIERAVERLMELRQKLAAPRTRHRERAKVAAAVEAILEETGTAAWITVTIAERTEETFRQQRRGRPGADTLYVKHERKRFGRNYSPRVCDRDRRCWFLKMLGLPARLDRAFKWPSPCGIFPGGQSIPGVVRIGEEPPPCLPPARPPSSSTSTLPRSNRPALARSIRA